MRFNTSTCQFCYSSFPLFLFFFLLLWFSRIVFCKQNSQSTALRMAWNPSCLPPARNTPFSARRLPYCVRGYPYCVSWHPYCVGWHPYSVSWHPYSTGGYPYERRGFVGFGDVRNRLYGSFSESWRSMGLSCSAFSSSCYLVLGILPLLSCCILVFFVSLHSVRKRRKTNQRGWGMTRIVCCWLLTYCESIKPSFW